MKRLLLLLAVVAFLFILPSFFSVKANCYTPCNYGYTCIADTCEVGYNCPDGCPAGQICNYSNGQCAINGTTCTNGWGGWSDCTGGIRTRDCMGPENYTQQETCGGGGSCTTQTGCSASYPGYRYNYTPSDYPTCSWAPPWPTWPGNYVWDPVCNSPPTGTISCPAQITLGQTGSFTLNGNDINGNLSLAGLYYSSTSSQHWYRNDNNDCNTQDCSGNASCTGASCALSRTWTPSALGSYYVTANYYDSASGQCSGNPYVSYPYSGYYACADPLTNDYCTVNVVPAPVNGVCGASDGGNFYSKPTLNLCSAGTASPSPVSGTGPWTWSCVGSNGGSTDPCSANLSIDGVCSNPDVHYTCSIGTNPSGSSTGGTNVSGATAWTWICNGSNGGTTDSCSESKPSAPNGTCLNDQFDPVTASTPVRWTWTTGDSLQVTTDSPPPGAAYEDWMYNSSPVASGIVITPPAGKYMPPGHTVYARTSFGGDWTTPGLPSAVSSVTCPVPTNPLPVTIYGPLQQKSGTGCYPADATNNFNVANPVVSTNPSSCVSTACTALDNNGSPSITAAAKYTCTTTFSNQNCLDDNPPTWPTSVTLTLTGNAPSGYTFVGWTPNGSCTPATNNKAVNAGDTVANQPITFNFSGSNWIKLKNNSFNGVSITGVTVPSFITGYDAVDDDATKYFIIGAAGSVLNTTVSPSTGYSNPNNWYASSYTKSSLMNPTTYLSYVKSRKEYQTVSAMSSINQDGVYVWSGDLTLNNTNLNQATASKFVLIVDGNVTIDQDKFNIGSCTDASGLKKIAILSKTGTITFSTSTQCAAGVFIAQTVNTGSITTQGLKIKGNLIAQTTLTNGRAWSDTSKPGLFVVFDPVQYINLLPYLSTASYDWRQIQ